VELRVQHGTGAITLVRVEHRGMDRFGAPSVRSALASPGGWPGILNHHARVVGGG